MLSGGCEIHPSITMEYIPIGGRWLAGGDWKQRDELEKLGSCAFAQASSYPGQHSHITGTGDKPTPRGPTRRAETQAFTSRRTAAKNKPNVPPNIGLNAVGFHTSARRLMHSPRLQHIHPMFNLSQRWWYQRWWYQSGRAPGRSFPVLGIYRIYRKDISSRKKIAHISLDADDDESRPPVYSTHILRFKCS